MIELLAQRLGMVNEVQTMRFSGVSDDDILDYLDSMHREVEKVVFIRQVEALFLTKVQRALADQVFFNQLNDENMDEPKARRLIEAKINEIRANCAIQILRNPDGWSYKKKDS